MWRESLQHDKTLRGTQIEKSEIDTDSHARLCDTSYQPAAPPFPFSIFIYLYSLHLLILQLKIHTNNRVFFLIFFWWKNKLYYNSKYILQLFFYLILNHS